MTRYPEVPFPIETRFLKDLIQRAHLFALLDEGFYRLFQGPFCFFETLPKAGDVKLRGDAYIKIIFSEEFRPEYYSLGHCINSIKLLGITSIYIVLF